MSDHNFEERLRESILRVGNEIFGAQGKGCIRTEPDIRAQMRKAVAEHQLRKDALALAEASEAKGRFIGRIEGVAWTLFAAALGALGMWLGRL